MHRFFAICIISFYSICLFAQNDSWFAYSDDSTGLVGFMDREGTPMILPKFSSISNTYKFDNIVPVILEKDGEFFNYYLLKDGNMVGIDSVYMFDMYLDCEHEGYIRFQDNQTQNVGIFNKHGKVVIPAEYNAVTQFSNGLAYALKNAKKYYSSSNDYEDEHWTWIEGEELLIDTSNTVLIKSFPYKKNIDLYSMSISSHPSNDKKIESYKGENGKYYNFINVEKHFTSWFLLHKDDILSKHCLSQLIYREEYDEWQCNSIQKIFNLYGRTISKEVSSIKQVSCSLEEDFNFHVEYDMLKPFLNNCGTLDFAKHPIVKVCLVENKQQVEQKDKALYFIKINLEYKFFSFSL